MRIPSLIAGVVVIACAHPAATTQVHYVHDSGTTTLKASLAEIQSQLDGLHDLAVKAKVDGDRAAVSDVASASSQAEFDGIMKGALVMVVAISRDAAELPPEISVSGQHGNLPLLRVAVLPPALTKQLKVDGQFGNNLWGGVFLAPLVKRFKGTLSADFGPKQRSFVLARDFPRRDPWTDPGGKDVTVSPDAVEAMCRREYPDFVIDPDFRTAMEALSAGGGPGKR